MIQNERDDVLLVAKVVPMGEGKALLWSFPKGRRVEGDENLQATALRVIEKEAGIFCLRMIDVLGSYVRNGLEDPRERKRITLYHYTTNETDFESQEPKKYPVAAWVQARQVARLLSHPKDREFFEKHVLKHLFTDKELV